MRLFVAAMIDEAARRRAAEALEGLKTSGADYKWVEPENLHLTLRFYGERNENDVPELSARLEEAAARPAFDATFSCVGAFDSLSRPKIVWLGLSQGASELAALAQALGEERDYAAHLTLGRQRSLKGLGALVKLLSTFELVPFSCRIERVALMKSTLSSKGPRYEALREARLS